MQTEQSDILKLTNVNKSFPGVKALCNMCMTVKKGEVHALVGENGAGKSTLMKILSGAYIKDSGTTEFCGHEVEITSPKQAERLGISIIYQELNLMKKLSVAENVFLGRYPRKNGFIDWKQMNKDAKELFDTFDIKMDVTAMVRSLSLAQQQLVEIIKAVSINSQVVIMDEPTSSLTASETETLFRIIQTLKDRHIAVIFITHRLDEIFRICDRLTVLRDGCFVGTKAVHEVTKSELISMMIGRELTQQFPPRKVTLGEVSLEVCNLSDGYRVKDVSFSARRGEVLGFAGLVGAGRTETMRLIFGADPKTSGVVRINGTEVNIRNPRQAVRQKIGFVTENRKEEGLFLSLPIKVNIAMVAYKKILTRSFFNFKKERQVAEQYVNDLHIVTPSVDQIAMLLSGGNQQKVVLAKWLLPDSEIVIFDEPTRGIDVGAKLEIYTIINNLAAAGKTIIVVSSEMEEVLGISDRIIVMREGRVVGELTKDQFSQQAVTELAIGGV